MFKESMKAAGMAILLSGVAMLSAAPKPKAQIKPSQASSNLSTVLSARGGLAFTSSPKGLTIHAAVRTGQAGCSVLVTWLPVKDADGYLVYRDGTLLTPAKLTKLTDATSILKTTNEEWPSIAKTLSISSPSEFFAGNVMDSQHPGQVKVDRETLRWTLAQMHANVAVVMGVGFIDQSPKLKAGKEYNYEVQFVKGLSSKVYEHIKVPCTDTRNGLGTTLPAQFTTYAGDQYLELLWPRTPNAGLVGFDLYRAVGASGTFQKANASPIVSVFKKNGAPLSSGPLPDPLFARPLDEQGHLKAEPSVPEPPGIKPPTAYAFFVDQTILKSELSLPPGSDPVPPEVVYELKNGVPVRYKVVPRDMFGPGYTPSQVLTLEPRDLLPPALPYKLTFESIESEWTLTLDQNPIPCLCSKGSCTNSDCCKGNFAQPELKHTCATGLRATWAMLARNVNNCPEELAEYRLYRYPTRDAALADEATTRVEVGYVSIPSGLQSLVKQVEDAKLAGDVIHWYRLKAVDKAGHSSLSVPYSASLPDQVPPLAPRRVRATETTDASKLIAVAWDGSQDALDPSKPCADVASYRVYRRVCGAKLGEKALRQLGWNDDLFRLVGEVDAQTLSFTDTKLPLMDNPIASTLCYEYCVRAVDRSGNQSLDSGGNVTCQRLTKIQGPKAPTITSLTGRTNSVRIDWVAPPVPDLYTFCIFRSEQELKLDDPGWGEPINDGPVFAAKVPCEATPPEGFPYAKGLTPAEAGKPPMHEGKEVNTYWYVDSKQVRPNRKYWYKIVSVDYWKNPFVDSHASILASSSPAMSTFTYGQQDLPSLAMSAPAYDSEKGVSLSWDAASVKGATYLLYRRNKASLLPDFVPLATALDKEGYLDQTARPGVTYQYAVQYLTPDQHYSRLSAPVEIAVPEGELVIVKP